MAKWYGTILIKIRRLHAIHAKNLIPILAELSICDRKRHFLSLGRYHTIPNSTDVHYFC